ncbi:MFS transporter [Kitasatospora sp. NPDC006697]|uniref:MFS transporter n=1 Tax=Kitasatospora sp. NPDC006697 TaxID=3364020 RepID=UPI0036CE2E5F
MTTSLARPLPTAATAGPRRRGLLPVLLAATFMTSLDFFIVNVAIPSLQTELRAGPSAVQWVVAGFGLALAAGLVLAGRLGDRFGRRNAFALGTALFTLASAGCGLAQSAGVLIAARVLQGLGAALTGPQVLAILRTGFTGPAQAKAFGAYAMTMGVGAVLGQLIGGLLIQANLFGLGWRTVFLINLPIGLAVLALVRRCVPESRAPGRGGLDLPGTVLVTTAVTALVLPLIQGRAQGWPLWTWACLIGSAALLAVFGLHQTRLATDPVVDPRLFRDRGFTLGAAAQLVFFLGQASFFLVLAVYLQQGRGLSALGSGLLFVSIGAGYLASSTVAPRLSERLGRQAIALGALVLAAGLGLLAGTAGQLGQGDSSWWLAPGLFVDGLGMGLVMGPLTTRVLAAVRPELAGSAAGVVSTLQQVGNALGVALLGNLFYGALPHGFAGAFAGSMLVLVALEVALALLVQALPKGGGRRG